MLLIDEASRVPDAMYKSLRPMLAVGNGELWMMSTPWGKRGFFWETGSKAAKPGSVTSSRHRLPAHRPEFLEEECRELGSRWFAQEYLCEFVDESGLVQP